MTAPIAVVTGAASGIGRALADGLSAAGYAVAAADLDREGAEKTAWSIRDRGGYALAFGVDVASADAVQGLADAVGKQMGRA